MHRFFLVFLFMCLVFTHGFSNALTEEETLYFKKLKHYLSQSLTGLKLLREAERKQYQFGGFLTYDSSGSTYPESRVIKISRGSFGEDVLSFAYELQNVIHSEQYADIIKEANQKKIDAKTYTYRFIELEAKAVYKRSLVASELGLDSFDSFHKDVSSLTSSLPYESKISTLAGKLLLYGYVQGEDGRMSVEEYYMNQYRTR